MIKSTIPQEQNLPLQKKTNDTLEATLLQLNDNMCSVTKSMSAM